jgi:ribonuclease Z
MFMGTSSAVPRPGHRNVSGMLLQFSCGSLTLIDCGEATQQQLMRSTVKFGNLDNILLTHLHGDHCYGIFGLMHTLNSSGRSAPLNIYGPSGVNELITTVLRLTGGWDGFELRITELKPDENHNFDLHSSSGKSFLASVHACPMVHRISAFGYVLREPEQPLVLDAVKAKSLGAQSRELGLLKSGQDITLPNGDVIRSSEVTSPGRAARTIGIMQDTCDASSAIPYMSNCDLLVHESTFENSMREKAIQYGHSTSGMAADFAAKVNAKNLVLTHFSSRYGEKGENEKLRREAQEVLKAHRTRIFLAEDFMSFSGTDFTTISSVAQQP